MRKSNSESGVASHRWRGGHASAVAETRRNMIYALVEATGAVLCGGEPASGEDWNWPMHPRRDAA